MNDKDKEEFENFWDDNYDEKFPTPDKFRDSIIWQAACEYKQKDIDELNKSVEFFVSENNHYFKSLEKLEAENAKLKEQDQIIAKEIKTYMTIAEKLQAENAKLRECVEFYAETTGWDNGKQSGEASYTRAREALAEISKGESEV